MKIHKDLIPERWYKFTLFEQLANVGTDVDRIIYFRDKDEQQSKKAFERA